MNSNAVEQIVPLVIRRYSVGGSVRHEVLQQILGEMPTGTPEPDIDPRRETLKAELRIVLLAYCREIVSDWFLQEGVIAGLMHFDRLLSFYTFENAAKLAQELIENRLKVVNHIEAVFFTHHEREANLRMRISQTGAAVCDSEAFVFALREGLKFGLSRAVANDFVAHDLPRIPVKWVDRFFHRDAKIVETGIARAVEFIGYISMTEVWMREDRSLYDPNRDPEVNRYRRILARKDLQILFVKALRANKQLFHLFRLGFGHVGCKPSVGNMVFDLSVPAQSVPSCHVADVFSKVQNPTGKHELWWLQAEDDFVERAPLSAARPESGTIEC